MYQFIVTTRGREVCVSDEATGWSSAGGNVGDIPESSPAGDAANRWASRAVVFLQLAAWTAVGIVLLEKGVGSLRRDGRNLRNSSLEITTTNLFLENSRAIDEQTKNFTDSLSVIPIDVDNLDSREKNDFDETTMKKLSTIDVSSVNDDRGNGVTTKIATTGSNDRRWETRNRSRTTRVNDEGGVAAAVAMVAVGSVMIVLGPAVMILRALDERRQERRFIKLFGEDDLPPSYEQATCELEPAPTYSSLNLDSIHVAPNPNDDPGCSGNSRIAGC